MIEHAAPTIAVVVVNFNGGQLAENCLMALLNQRCRAERIIVIDNASSDGSYERLRDLADSEAGIASRLQLIRLDRNSGFAGANNHAFSLIDDCDWVALLNPDTLPPKQWIAQLTQAVQDEPDYRFFSCRLVSMDQPGILDGTGDSYHVNGLAWRRDHGASVERQRDREDVVFGPCAAAALYNLAALRKAGAFDEAYFCYNEDTDLAFRLRLIGERCLHLDRCEVLHVGSAISGYQSDFSIYYGHRNLVWTYFKNMPTGMLWRYLPFHLLLNLVSLLYFSFKGRPRVILRAKWHALLGLRRVLNERGRVQKLKQVPDRELRQAMVSRPLAAYLHRHEV